MSWLENNKWRFENTKRRKPQRHKMKILVTGGAGLIGFNVAKYYHGLNHEVVVADNMERSKLLGHDVSEERVNFNANLLKKMNIPVHEIDVSLIEGWNHLDSEYGNFDAIFHMAAQCGVPTSIENPGRDFEVNAIGTFNMLEMARDWGSKVVYASTNKVYPLHSGWRLNDSHTRWEWSLKEFRENGFPVCAMDQASRTPYGASKYTGDLLCQEFYHAYGVKTGVFRMSCIYGPNQFGFEEQGWATWFAIATLKEDPINIFGDGRQVRDMLWVDDLVQAYDAYLMSTVDHGVWNMGGGPGLTLSLNECIDTLERITGKRSHIDYHDWRPSDQRVYTSDIRNARDELGWEPQISPHEGLTRIVKWVRPILEVF